MSQNKYKHKLTVIFIISILFIIGLALLLNYNPISHIQCTFSSGNFKQRHISPGVSRPGYYCHLTYSDADKSCISSSECEGNCLISDETQVDYSKSPFGGEVIGGTGRCEVDNSFNGCFKGTIENPFSGCI